jgi:hypothetical protein
MLKPPPWIERAKATYRFHASKCREHPGWKLEATASVLKRSLGSISQDITVASWLKTHEEDLIKFKYLKDALEFVRRRKEQLKGDDSFLSE